jgi:hypothetical protein
MFSRLWSLAVSALLFNISHEYFQRILGRAHLDFFAGASEGTTDDLAAGQSSPRDSKGFWPRPGNELPDYYRVIPSGLTKNAPRLTRS